MTRIISEDDLKSLLGEGFHTGFRKAAESSNAANVWHEINRMPDGEYEAVIKFLLWGMNVSGVVFAYRDENGVLREINDNTCRCPGKEREMCSTHDRVGAKKGPNYGG